MKQANLLDQLLIFRNLLQDPLIRKVCDFFDSKKKTPPSEIGRASCRERVCLYV